MRFSIRDKVLLASACMMLGAAAWGQAATEPQTTRPASSIDLALTYNASRTNNVSGANFWMQGGSVQFHGQFWRGLGAVVDVSGLHTGNNHSSGVGLDLVAATFGPRYTWQLPRHRFATYGQALAGEAFGFHSVFPNIWGAKENASSMAVKIGGGLTMKLSGHFLLRPIEAGWLRTQLPNGSNDAQNSFLQGAGFVFHRN